jgi:hypothetical protein
LYTLTSAFALACGGDDLLLPGDATATRIAIAGGDGQQGAVGATLAESISVLVSDVTGRPVMGQPVAFAVTAGEGAELNPDTATTGADGRAGARWVLGRDVGTQRAQAELVTGEPDAAPSVVFTASASPGSAAALVLVSGDDQSAPASSALPDSLVVRATDAFGNPVAGLSVAWAVTGGGSVSPALVTTGGNGRAAVRRILGNVPGSQGATASAGGVSGSPVAFSHTATTAGGGGDDDDDQGRVTIVSGNDQTGDVDKELRDPLVIRVTDQAGRGISGAAVVWVVTEGGGSAKPVFGTTDGSGRANTRWTLGPQPGLNRLSAVVTGLGTVNFEAHGTRRGDDDGDDSDDRIVRLSFLVQPSDSEEDERLSPAVQVAAVNVGGATVPSAEGEVEVRLGRNPEDARLRGDRTQRFAGGVATFDDLRVDKEGGSYTLIAGVGGLPDVESAPFQIDD